MRGALLVAGWAMLVALDAIGAAGATEPGPMTLDASELATIGRRAAPPTVAPPALPAPAPVDAPKAPEAPPPAVAGSAPASLVIEPFRPPPPVAVARPAARLGPDELAVVGRRVQPVPLPAAPPVAVAGPVTVAAALPPAFARPAPRPVMTTGVERAAGPVLLDATRLSLIGP